MKRCRRSIVTVIVLLMPSVLAADPAIVDDFEKAGAWSVLTADGVAAKLSSVDGPAGKALRLDYDFQDRFGFVVVRRDLDLTLPDNYRFAVDIRGEGEPNNLEFKLVEASEGNVWWHIHRDWSYPADWRRLAVRKRQIHFAWGPSSATPLAKLGALEFAVSTGSGGKGWIEFDNLSLEALQPPRPVPPVATVTGLSKTGAGPRTWKQPLSDGFEWTGSELTVDFGFPADVGAVALDLGSTGGVIPALVVEHARAADAWQVAARADESPASRRYVRLPEVEARYIRIRAAEVSPANQLTVKRMTFAPPDHGQTVQAFGEYIAGTERRGMYPRHMLREHAPWTVVGIADDPKEALFCSDGALEVDKASFSIEPFIVSADGTVTTWADVVLTHSLADGHLPIPTVSWRNDRFALDITAVATGEKGQCATLVRYDLRNLSEDSQAGHLYLALRPYQVLPAWQDLNVVGGVARIDSIALDGSVAVVNGTRCVMPWTAPDGFGASAKAEGDVAAHLAVDRLPRQTQVTDADGTASAAMRYDFQLAPGARKAVVVGVPLYESRKSAAPPAGGGADGEHFDAVCAREAARWQALTGAVELRLPDSARRVADSFRAIQAHILINGDGPAIQPGSRTYERSWMRDGALTSTALLATGHFERVRGFLDWYAGYQFPDGKVPAVVDRRGPDPVAEWDSQGEFIYAMCAYARRTGDLSLLEKHLDKIVGAVDFVEHLRAQRMSATYCEGPPEMRALCGIVPESISHEGYFDPPRHSYWDNFFIIKGLKDAVTVAQMLERPDLEERFAKLRDDYRAAVYASMQTAMTHHQIEYIPGCAELGDFDATSTTIGLWPCGELGRIPEPQLHNTFTRYYKFFTDRRADTIEWKSYTPYETRVIGSFVLLGWRERAQEAVRYFLGHQLPQGWNQWGEVVWRDPRTPGYVGDIPHTWVGSDFLNSVVTMLAYERAADGALVIGAGVPNTWLAEAPGIAVGGLRTACGPLSYRARAEGGEMILELLPGVKVPPAGVVVDLPGFAQATRGKLNGRTVTRQGDEWVVREAPATLAVPVP